MPTIWASLALPEVPVHSAWTPDPSRQAQAIPPPCAPSRPLGDIEHPTPQRTHCVPLWGKPCKVCKSQPSPRPHPLRRAHGVSACMQGPGRVGLTPPLLPPRGGSPGSGGAEKARPCCALAVGSPLRQDGTASPSRPLIYHAHPTPRAALASTAEGTRSAWLLGR